MRARNKPPCLRPPPSMPWPIPSDRCHSQGTLAPTSASANKNSAGPHVRQTRRFKWCRLLSVGGERRGLIAAPSGVSRMGAVPSSAGRRAARSRSLALRPRLSSQEHGEEWHAECDSDMKPADRGGRRERLRCVHQSGVHRQTRRFNWGRLPSVGGGRRGLIAAPSGVSRRASVLSSAGRRW